MKGEIIGAVLGFTVYAIYIGSIGEAFYRKDSQGVYRFRYLGTLKQGIEHPCFRSAPDKKHTMIFFFRLDNPWFTVPFGALLGSSLF